MKNILAEITLNALKEGEVFSGADREYAFQIRKGKKIYLTWERDDSGKEVEKELSETEMMEWLIHFPLFHLKGQLQDYLIRDGMKFLKKGNTEAAFLYFTRAAEHEMLLGNIGLALIYYRNNEPEKAVSAFRKTPLSTGVPFTEIPVKSFLLTTGIWDDSDETVRILTELKKILPTQKDVISLLKMLSPPDSAF